MHELLGKTRRVKPAAGSVRPGQVWHIESCRPGFPVDQQQQLLLVGGMKYAPMSTDDVTIFNVTAVVVASQSSKLANMTPRSEWRLYSEEQLMRDVYYTLLAEDSR